MLKKRQLRVLSLTRMCGSPIYVCDKLCPWQPHMDAYSPSRHVILRLQAPSHATRFNFWPVAALADTQLCAPASSVSSTDLPPVGNVGGAHTCFLSRGTGNCVVAMRALCRVGALWPCCRDGATFLALRCFYAVHVVKCFGPFVLSCFIIQRTRSFACCAGRWAEKNETKQRGYQLSEHPRSYLETLDAVQALLCEAKKPGVPVRPMIPRRHTCFGWRCEAKHSNRPFSNLNRSDWPSGPA